jgi:hypothetical protein
VNFGIVLIVPDPPILALNVLQFAELRAPRFVAEAVGRLKVWVVPELAIAKSVPLVPTAKV